MNVLPTHQKRRPPTRLYQKATDYDETTPRITTKSSIHYELFPTPLSPVNCTAVTSRDHAGHFTGTGIQYIGEMPEVADIEQDPIPHACETRHFALWVCFSNPPWSRKSALTSCFRVLRASPTAEDSASEPSLSTSMNLQAVRALPCTSSIPASSQPQRVRRPRVLEQDYSPERRWPAWYGSDPRHCLPTSSPTSTFVSPPFIQSAP